MKSKLHTTQIRRLFRAPSPKTLLLFGMVLTLLPGLVKAQMSGSYTICSSGCNYSTFNAAVADLNSQGVSGPVTFNVSAETFNESVYINPVSGASATNTITFQGQGKYATTLTQTYNTVLNLNSCSYISFRDMGFLLQNNNYNYYYYSSYNVYTYADSYCTFEKCLFSSPGSTYNYYYYNYDFNIYSQNSLNLTVDNCCLYGGYYGIYLNGYNYYSSVNNGGDKITNNHISNTTYGLLTSFYNYYYYNSGSTQQPNEYSGNHIDSINNNGYGIQAEYENGGTIKNNVIGAGCWASIYIYDPNATGSNASSQLNVYNNMCLNYTGYGVYLYNDGYYSYYYGNSNNTENILVAHNTCYSDANYNPSAAIGIFDYNYYYYYYGYGSGNTLSVSVLNNICARNSSGNVLQIYSYNYGSGSSGTSFASIDGNDLYSTGGPIAQVYGNNYNTFADYQAVMATYGFEAHATNVLPTFKSGTDLHLLATGVIPAGVPTSITTDIDGDTRSSTTPTAGADEASGTGLSFDGTDDNIVVPNNSGFNTSTYTAEAWVYLTGGSAYKCVFGKRTSTDGWNVFADNSDHWTLWNGWSSVIAGPSVSYNTWTHVAVTGDANGQKLYINGALAGSTTAVVSPSASQDFNIGNTSDDHAWYFGGTMDEIRFWNRSLCQGEIQAHMNGEIQANQSSLVAYYKFNEGLAFGNNPSVTTLIDATPNGNTGTLNNFALSGMTSNWVYGNVNGQAAVYNGDLLVYGNNVQILTGNNVTSSADNTDFGATGTSATTNRTFTLKNIGTSTISVGAISFSGANASDFAVVTAPSASLVPTASTTMTISFHPGAIGARNATLNFSSSDCYNPSFSFAVSGTGFQSASALNFGGNYEQVNLNSSLGNYGTGDFSIQMRVRTSGQNNMYLFSKRGYCGGDNFLSMMVLNGHFSMETDDWSNAYTSLTGTAVVNDGNWHQLSAVRQNGILTLYVDGVSDASGASTADLNNYYTGTLGRSVCTWYNGSVPYNGDMDELRFWNRALCKDEINNNLTCELSGTPTGLQAYYKFNEGFINANNSTVTTLTDASGNGNDGTLYNFILNGTGSNWVDGGTLTACSAFSTAAINVSGNNNTISAGSTTTSTSNATDFGQVMALSTSNTYTISNTGNADLTVSSISLSGTDASAFSVSGISLPATIAANGSSTFTMTFQPGNTGVKNAVVTINNNDCHNTAFAFAIKGELVCSAPAFTACPSEDIVANTDQTACNAIVNYSDAATGTPAPAVTYSFSGATSGSGNGDGSGAVFNKGVTSVTVTAANACGTATCTFNVVVNDATAPMVMTKPATIYLDANGSATLSASDVDNGSADNCSNVTLSLDKTSFKCADLGDNTVKLTATDASNNSATAPATVTVADKIAPIAKTKNITVNLVNGSGSIQPADVDNGSSDNCSFTLTLDKSNFTCADAGVNTVTLTATDASGNSSSATATVTVNAAASASITASGPTTFCDGNSVTLTANSGSVYSWTNDVGPLLGGQGQSTTIITSGTYYVTVTNSYGCFATSAGVTVTVNPIPVAVANTSPSTVFYGYTTAFNTATLSATSDISGSSYSWTSAPSGFTSSSQSATVTPSAGTTYSVTATSPAGCVSPKSSVTVKVIDVRCGNNNNKVTLCHNCNTICIDASAVPAHLANHPKDHLGSCGPCQAMEERELEDQFNVFPNPFSSTTNIALVFAKDQQVSVEVWSIDGKLIKTIFTGNVSAASQYNYVLDGSMLMPGMYFVKVVSEDHVDYRKIELMR
jgi:hypothetical protein